MHHIEQLGVATAHPNSSLLANTAPAPRPSRLRAAFTTVAAGIALLSAGFFSLSAPSAAHAHDELVGYSLVEASPSNTTDAPTGFMLNFNNELTPLGAEVIATDAAGQSIAAGDPVLNGRDLTQNFVTDLEAGEYPITWTVVSSDGHRISGALALTIDADTNATLEIADIPQLSAGNTPATEEAATDSATEPNLTLIISASIAGVGVLAALIVLMVRKIRETNSGNQASGDQK